MIKRKTLLALSKARILPITENEIDSYDRDDIPFPNNEVIILKSGFLICHLMNYISGETIINPNTLSEIES